MIKNKILYSIFLTGILSISFGVSAANQKSSGASAAKTVKCPELSSLDLKLVMNELPIAISSTEYWDVDIQSDHLSRLRSYRSAKTSDDQSVKTSDDQMFKAQTLVPQISGDGTQYCSYDIYSASETIPGSGKYKLHGSFELYLHNSKASTPQGTTTNTSSR